MQGFDGIEFASRLAEEFEIALRLDETREQATVGETYDYLRSRLPRGMDEPRLLKQTFYRLRDVMVTELSIPRRIIRPSARIDSLFNLHRLGRQHRIMQKVLDFELPPIVRRRQDERTNWGAVAFVAAFAIVPFAFLEGFLVGMIAVAVGMLFTLGVGFLDIRNSPAHPWRVLSSDTVADLVERTIITNKPAMGSWSDARIWLTLKHLVVEQAIVFASEIAADTHYVRDLNFE